MTCEVRTQLSALEVCDRVSASTEHPTDEWIRIHLGPGDLIDIPRGIYHRFMLDEQNAIAGLRLWKVCCTLFV